MIDRCILCGKEGVEVIKIGDDTMPFICECENCGQQFSLDDIKSWQEDKNKRKSDSIINWYKVYLLTNGNHWLLVYHASNFDKVVRFSEHLARSGVWKSKVKAEYFEKHGLDIHYICKVDLEIENGMVIT